ncbi:MAG: hypothetical protein DCF21_02905 [Leptolyngbya sp.]|jgi:hypothetical protein|uniref:Uncharacterized protein n=1 Tax=Shackletoniella antarctica TaxID=268115 RepID=A0A2W4WF31_9CYAN|nr:MAG: hypothetical protein DCF17_10270 [Shackletoniella antarctica]PZV21229.1 MAG: hypothetical protein DCF21_02905 [Leptolyngbya sp.]
MALSDILHDQALKAKVVDDCTHLIDRQVAAKGGLGGMALKATYGVVKGVGAGYIPGAIGRILPEVVTSLEPMWAEGEQAGDPVAYLSQNQTQAADVILGVTDDRVANTNNGLVKSSYSKLRQSVKGDVAGAVPGLAEILGAYSSVSL